MDDFQSGAVRCLAKVGAEVGNNNSPGGLDSLPNTNEGKCLQSAIREVVFPLGPKAAQL